jgi:acetyl-CoA C-acetyltransferase
MSNGTGVVVLGAVRTAIGGFGGSLKDIPPTELGATAIREAVSRAGIEGGDIGHVVMGNVIHTEPKDMYLSRVAAMNAGIPMETPALTLNRLCGSGLQAIVTATQHIMLGDCESAVGGGAESMSRSPMTMPAARWGQKMGDSKVIDVMVGALSDPFGNGHMGITAENLAERYQITREAQDEFALESHKRAANAVKAGYFKDQIVPVEVKVKRDTIAFDTDEHIRMDATIEDMARLRAVFKKDGTVTAGNASGINDAASALVLMNAEAADKKGLKPMARIVAYGHAGVAPEIMGIGPVNATRNALEKAGLSIEDIDVIESNEAFAAQACAVARDLGFDPAKTNPNGGAIALGHPIGASGSIIFTKMIYELKRTGGKYGLATMCIGGGQGIAVIAENLG